jgi:hypothetical protein
VPDELHVSTTADVPTASGIVAVHRTRTVHLRDVIVLNGVRISSPARTLVDLAPELDERDTRYLVARVVQRKKLHVGYLVEEITRFSRHPGTHDLRSAITAVACGARSGGEVALLQGLVSRGWHPRPNRSVALAEGGSREGDLLFEEIRTVIQVESMRYHGLPPDLLADSSRDMDYARVWFLTLRAWTSRIEGDLGRLLDELVMTLTARAHELGVPLEVARGRPDNGAGDEKSRLIS